MTQKALIYCRVSDKKQVTNGHGLDSQETRCVEYATNKQYEIAAIFTDDRTGGGDFMKRPGMVSLLQYLDAHSTEQYVVIFDDLKRYARDTVFHLKLRHEMAVRNAIRECLNFNFEDSPEGEFVETVFAAQAQLERQQNSRQVRQKMQARLMNGYWVFHAPVGYKYANKPGYGKMLVRDEPLASILQEGLESFASGRFETLSELKLFFESHPEYPKNPKGEVHYQRIQEVLDRVTYAGYIDLPNWSVSMRPAQHEAIISFDTWKRIQDRLKAEAKVPARKDINEDFPLRGFITCGCCGDPMTSCWAKGRNGKYPYYYCQHKTCELYGKTVRREKIEGEFEQLLSSLQPSKDLFDMATAMFKQLWNFTASRQQEEGQTLKHQLQKIDQKIGQFLERIVETDSPILVTTYETQIKKLDEEKTGLQEKIKNCGRPIKNFDETYRTAMSFLGSPYNIWINGSLEHKRTVLKLVFAEKLQYHRNEGYRTASTSLPFRVLEGLQECNLKMVPGSLPYQQYKHMILCCNFYSTFRGTPISTPNAI